MADLLIKNEFTDTAIEISEIDIDNDVRISLGYMSFDRFYEKEIDYINKEQAIQIINHLKEQFEI